jgi:hypothetical protein
MKTLTLELKVILTTIDDNILPYQAQLSDEFTGYICKYNTEGGVTIQSVNFTSIYGEEIAWIRGNYFPLFRSLSSSNFFLIASRIWSINFVGVTRFLPDIACQRL